MPLAVVDAGPLYAAADRKEADHTASVLALSRQDLQLVVPAMVVTEATYSVAAGLALSRRRPSFAACSLDIEGPSADDVVRMAELVEQYADFPLGGADASVIALAERLAAPIVITVDRRHFGAVRPRHRAGFALAP